MEVVIYAAPAMIVGLAAYCVMFALLHITAKVTIVKIRGFPKNIRPLVAAIAIGTATFDEWYRDAERTTPPPQYTEMVLV
jgi:uncharacterized membrane protein